MHRLARTFPFLTASLALLLFLSIPMASARTWELGDPVVERVRALINAREFSALLDTLPPMLEEAQATGNTLRLARLICAEGQAQLGTGKVGESLLTLERSLKLSEELADTITIMTAMGVRSLALNGQGRFNEAIDSSREQIIIATAAGDSVAMAFAQLSIGYAELNRAHPREAQSWYAEAATNFGRAGRTRWQLSALTGGGRAASNAGDIEEARRTYREVQSLAQSIGDLANEADATNNLGVLQYNHGDISIAAEHFERARDLQLRLDDPTLAMTAMSNVALMRMWLGDFENSAEVLQDVRDLAQELGATLNYQAATGDLATLRTRQGRHNSAIRLQREVVTTTSSIELRWDTAASLALNLIKVDSAATALDVAREVGSDVGEPKSRFKIALGIAEGSALLALERPEESATRLRELAESNSNPSLEPTLRALLSLSLAQCGKATEARREVEAAVAALEGRRQSTLSKDWREVLSEGSYRVIVDAIAGDIRSSGNTGPSAERNFHLLQRMKARTLVERVSSPEGEADFRFEPVTLRRVQSDLLGPGDLLLDYHVGRNATLLFAVTTDSARCVVLPVKATALENDIGLLRDATTHPPTTEGDGAMVTSVARRMGSLLLEPVGEWISGARRVLYCPDGILAALPVGLLATSGESELPLLSQCETVRIPASSMLRVRDGGVQARRSLLALSADGESLTGASREISSLRKSIDGVTVLEGFVDGLIDSLRERSVIHVAAHTDPDNIRPWHSGIRLTDPQEDLPGTRTHLRASDILGERLDASLAVLSTCESGLGRLSAGQGVLGLSSAFLAANVSAVVSTLWKIDDRVTRDLMRVFYDQLLAGSTVSAAVRHAQLHIREQPETAHPYFWAGFVVVGDGSIEIPLRPAPSRNWTLPVTVAALGSLTLLGWGIRRRKT